MGRVLTRHHASSKSTPLQKQGEASTVSAEPEISEPHTSEEPLRQSGLHLHHAHAKEVFETLAYSVAHDFNNILTSIFGSTELALLKIQNHVAVGHELKTILTAATRGQDLVKQFLHFGPTQSPEKKPIPLHTLVQETLHLFRAMVPPTIEVHEKLVMDSDTILANPTQIHQVLMNLLVNAGYAMRTGVGVLECRLELEEVASDFMQVHPSLKAGPYLKLMVRDTGEGMAPHVLKRIFDPFFTTKRKGEGTGMGLAIAQRIITHHGGTITVKSSEEEGTTITIFLPRIHPVPRKN